MVLDDILERLASFEPTGFPFISLYLNLQPDEHGRDNYAAFVRKAFSERANTYPVTGTPREINYNEQKVETVLGTYEAQGTADLDLGDPRVVADELVRRAQATGASITFIEDTSLLADVGGVGATLRYQI